MPINDYYEYFGPDYTLHVAPSNMENKNSQHQLDDIRSKLLDNLSKLRHAPSVQFQERPPDTELPEVSNCASIVNRNLTYVSLSSLICIKYDIAYPNLLGKNALVLLLY
jgi:hypothetical protein